MTKDEWILREEKVATDPAGRIAAADGPSAREALLALALFLAATLAYILPFMGDPRGTLGPDRGDPRLNLYFLLWGGQQISLGLPDLWNAPFFHPTPGALTISDHLLGPAVQTLALGALGVDGATAYNLLFLSSFALGGLTTWWLLRRAGLGFVGALLGGWIYAFAHSRWDEASHLQILLSQWLPATLLAWNRLLEEPRWRRVAVFLAFYALQVTGGVYLAVLLHFGLVAICLARGRSLLRQLGSNRGQWARMAVALALGAALYLPLAVPYAIRDKALRAPAPRAELRRYGATLGSFLAPSRHSNLERLGIFPAVDRGALFLGFAASSLALLGLAGRLRPAISPTTWRRRDLLAIVAGGVLLAGGLVVADLHTLGRGFGPLWKKGPELGYHFAVVLAALGGVTLWRTLRRVRQGPLWLPWELPIQRGLMAVGLCGGLLSLPMVLALVQDLAPPLAALRVSHRSFVLALPALGLLAGQGLERLLGRLRPGAGRALVGGLLFVAVAGELAPRLPPWLPVPAAPADFPAYTTTLRDASDVTGYVELPLTPGWRETERMYLQTRNWKPLVNGYSAVTPDSYWEIGRLFHPMPDLEGLARLRELGVSHLVVHLDAERPGLRKKVQRWIRKSLAAGDIEPVAASQPTSIYRIASSPPNPRPRAEVPRIESR
jgi:hypothetical protein